MATIVVMPQLGNSVESCIIVEWMIVEGDSVAVDQTLASIETDKSTMEVPSTAEGTVLKLLWEEGDEVPVKDPLIIVGEPGEDISGLVPGDDAAPIEDAPEKATAAPEQAAPAFATERATGAVSPRARALAASAGVDASAISEGSGPHGRVIERAVAAAIAAGHEAGDVLAGGADDDEGVFDGDLVAFLPQELQDGALGGGGDLHRRLVRFDGREGLVDGDGVAFGNHPLDDDA